MTTPSVSDKRQRLTAAIRKADAFIGPEGDSIIVARLDDGQSMYYVDDSGGPPRLASDQADARVFNAHEMDLANDTVDRLIRSDYVEDAEVKYIGRTGHRKKVPSSPLKRVPDYPATFEEDLPGEEDNDWEDFPQVQQLKQTGVKVAYYKEEGDTVLAMYYEGEHPPEVPGLEWDHGTSLEQWRAELEL